jgi:hypothetical protein
MVTVRMTAALNIKAVTATICQSAGPSKRMGHLPCAHLVARILWSVECMSVPLVSVPRIGPFAQKPTVPKDTAIPCGSVALLSLFIERAKGFHHVIKPDRFLAAGHVSQRWARLDCARIRGP